MKKFTIFLLTLCYICHEAFAACDAGWMSFQDSCYKYFATKKNWQDAKTACESERAHLAIVMTNEENNFLKAELRKLHIGGGEQIWMDGTDVKTEGTFIWANTGEFLEIMDWGPNEPNQSGGNEDCLSFFEIYDFKWNDEHCDREFAYLCERQVSNGPVVG